jgi:hypothetical protein
MFTQGPGFIKSVSAIAGTVVFSAPFTTNGADTIAPIASFRSEIGTPTFSASGMFCDSRGGADYENFLFTNTKLNPNGDTTKAYSYTVDVVFDLAQTSASTNASDIFYLNGTGVNYGFGIYTGNRLTVSRFPGTLGGPVDLMAVPASASLELRFEAGSNNLKYLVNGALVYTDTGVTRTTTGLVVGMVNLCCLPVATFKNAKLTVT